MGSKLKIIIGILVLIMAPGCKKYKCEDCDRMCGSYLPYKCDISSRDPDHIKCECESPRIMEIGN